MYPLKLVWIRKNFFSLLMVVSVIIAIEIWQMETALNGPMFAVVLVVML
jgi:hypothetical protein